jgi:transcriptional regulator with XRE-family HTH domain
MTRHGTAALLAELRRELRSRGLRVAWLAKGLGVAEPTVWRWLRGEGLTLERMDQICGLLDVDLRDLVARGEVLGEEAFTLAQERILAADRGLALVFFAILHGAGLRDLESELALPPQRLASHLERLTRLGLIEMRGGGRVRARVRRSVRWRKGGPLSVAFDQTVKPLFLSMDFGSPDALYVSDMVALSAAGRARVQALFEALRDDIHTIVEQERAARLPSRAWTGLLMMVRPFDLRELTSEWRTDEADAP